jgi:hypothetical protein
VRIYINADSNFLLRYFVSGLTNESNKLNPSALYKLSSHLYPIFFIISGHKRPHALLDQFVKELVTAWIYKFFVELFVFAQLRSRIIRIAKPCATFFWRIGKIIIL